MSTSEEYKEFLASVFWANLSDSCKHRAGRKCERCGSKHMLQAHHRFYRDDWYSTQLGDLECLCRDCHKKEHGIKVKVKKHHPITRRRGKKKFKPEPTSDINAIKDWKHLCRSRSRNLISRRDFMRLRTIFRPDKYPPPTGGGEG